MYKIGYIDLHVHLRGTLDAATAHQIALTKDSRYQYVSPRNGTWDSFSAFLDAYHQNGLIITTARELETLAFEYLKRSSKIGVVYVEFMHSLDHSLELGIGYDEQLEAISRGCDRARKEFGIHSGLILTIVRHRGPETALRLANWLKSADFPIIVGMGLTGDESRFSPIEFEVPFRIAKERGLGLTAHAGEWGNAKSVRKTVEQLHLDRVGHGLSAARNDEALDFLIERSVAFEVCLSSNLSLGAVTDIADHPLRKLLEKGARFALCTDDPAYFQTDSKKEYDLAASVFSMSEGDIRAICQQSLDASFCDAGTREKIQKQLTGFLNLKERTRQK